MILTGYDATLLTVKLFWPTINPLSLSKNKKCAVQLNAG